MISSATANPILSGHFRQFMRDTAGFVGFDLFPIFTTGMQSADYYVFKKENELQQPAAASIKRAPGSKYARLQLLTADDNYRCDNYGLEVPVPDEDRAKYATYFDADTAAARKAADTIKLSHEQRVYTAVSGLTNTASPSVKWDDGASNPKVDIDAAKESIRKGIGIRANLLVFSERVMQVLEIHPKIIELFKHTRPGVLNTELLASYFGVSRVRVADAVVATSQEGQTLTADDIWADDVVLAHVNPTQDLSVLNMGRTFAWTLGGAGMEAAVRSYRDDSCKSDIHQADHYTDEKIQSQDAGYLLTNVLAGS